MTRGTRLQQNDLRAIAARPSIALFSVLVVAAGCATSMTPTGSAAPEDDAGARIRALALA